MASNIENNELAKAYKGKDLAPDLNIQEFLAGLEDDNPEGLEYPYTCPKCGRQFKTTISLEVHLESFDHNNPPEDYDPCNPEWKPKKRDERLKELSLKTDSAPNSPRPMQTPTQPKGRPQKTPSSRGRKSFGSHRKRKFYRRGSDVTNEQAPTKTRVRVDEDGNVTSENLTWAQAQRLVEVEDDASNRIYRLSIFEDLEVDTVEQGKPRPSASRIPVPESDIKEISELDASRTHKLDPDYLKYSPKIDENGVEYFMDDEDHVWLEKVNDTRQKSHGMKPVTHDQFEGVIDRLEKDSIFETNSKKNSLDDTDNAVCCVCNDGECNNTNQIIFCDLCNLAVHQECYGVPYIPEGQWLCRRCSFSPSRPVDCVVYRHVRGFDHTKSQFSPNILGAFKQTVDNKWCHVVCALWIPEISFQNPVFLEPIDGLRNVPKARWNLKCYICKKSGCGASIQCNKANCYTAFHVTCAQHAGLYMVMRVEKGDNINGITTTNVTKTAYCHSHTPKNWSPRLLKTAERGFDRSREEQIEDRVNEARENICGRRHTQMISKPYIPFEKIPSLINDYIPPQLGRSTAFFQQCLTYWSQKRQIRNGVPLIRRLQSQISKTPASGESDEQKLKMREQLRYWQRLRHDLERARLLTEQIKKREKLKLQEISKSKQLTQLKMYPWGQFLKSCIEELKEAPMYSKIIDEPMDLGTMSKKIDNFQYKCFAAFEYDIALICRNCCHYNDSTTIFYRLGMDYKSKTTAWLKNVAKKVKEERFNTATGTFLADGVEMDTKPEYDFHLDWYSKLAQRQADLEKEKNGSTKTKLLKQCKQDQVKVKRILQKLGHDFEADEVEANGKHPDEETPSSSCSGSNDEKPNGVIPQKNSQVNGDHPTTNGTTDPTESNGSSFDDENGVFQGPKIEENGNIVMHDGEQEIKGDSQVLENQVSGDDDDHLHNFQPLDLVWAKCSGYPWYPALIFDADLSQDEPILHGDEELPQPSFDIIEIGNKLNRNQDDTERYNLVLFFDARRTWQWLPRNKIALLGKDREFDSQKKNEGKTAALRKSVQKAYSRATQQAQNI